MKTSTREQREQAKSKEYWKNTNLSPWITRPKLGPKNLKEHN